MSGLQLGDNPIPETDPKPDNLTLGAPGPSSDGQNPSAHPPISSTPLKLQQEHPDGSNVSATASSEHLGSTIHAAHDSTTSVPGFESASVDFHRDASSSVPPTHQAGPGVSEAVSDTEMGQDITREVDTDMDTTHQSAYTQHDDSQPVAQPDPINQSSTGQDSTVQLVAQLLQAQQAGTLADVTNQLHGAQAEQLAELLKLARAGSDPTGAGRDRSTCMS